MEAEEKFKQAFEEGLVARVHGIPLEKCPYRKGGLKTVEVDEEKHTAEKAQIPYVWYDGWVYGWRYQDTIYRLRSGNYVSPTAISAA